jgi:predicted neutral ceramidase superfamily lipid hydrolase
MNIIKRSIPSISGIITGIFAWDLQANKSPKSMMLLALAFLIIFNIIWISCSKIFKKDKRFLEKDALTYLPFIILILFPVRYLANFDSKYMQFGSLPSLILLTLSISLFLFLKTLYLKNQIKDIEKDRLIYLIMIIYFILFSLLTIFKHQAFFSTGHDLGIYDQVVWGYKNFHFANSLIGDIWFIYKSLFF